MLQKKLLLLCNHVPERDPRIDWVASLASEYFDTTVIGYLTFPDPAGTADAAHPYQIKLIRGWEHEKLLPAMRKLSKLGISHCLRYILLNILFATVFLKWAPRLYYGRNPQTAKAQAWKFTATSDAQDPVASASADTAMPIAPPRKATVLCNVSKRLHDVYWNTVIYMTPKLFASALLLNCGETPSAVVISADYYTLEAGTALKKAFHSKLIYDAHEFAPYMDPEASIRFTRKLLRSERKRIRCADYSFTVNPMLATEMNRAYDVPIGSVPNCAPLETMRATVADDMTALAGSRVKFLFLGRFSAGRGIPELLWEWRNVDPNKAALFLRGPAEPYTEAMKALSREYGLWNTSVYFLPPLSEAELIAGAANADVGIIPYLPVCINHLCCCPNKLSQYMQAGLAILAQDTRYVKDRVETYQNGLIYDAEKPGSICDAVMQLAGRPDLLKEMQMHSRTAAQNDFNWAVQSTPLRKVLAELA